MLSKLKPSQKVYVKRVLSQKFTELLYGGTAGTGKTFVVASLNCMIINDFHKSRVGVFRKNLTTARKTVWHTYIKALRELGLEYDEVKGSEPKITLKASGSVIEFYEMDMTKDPDWNKLKGLELSIAHIDEANEVDVTGRNIAITRVGRWNENGCPDFITMTCNPSQGWVKEEYRDPYLNGTILPHRTFIETTAEELEPDFKKRLETLPERERARYLDNDWNYLEDPNQLIKYEWLKEAIIEPSDEVDILGVDVAGEGNDNTIAAHRKDIDGVKYINKLEHIKENNTIVMGEILLMRVKEKGIQPKNLKIDVVGIGVGVYDYMRGKGIEVTPYNAGSSPVTKQEFLSYKNKRAEDYWNLRDGLANGTVKLIYDEALFRELTNIRYFIKERFIQIESKQEIKKRLGYSPDRADAVCIATSIVEESTFNFIV
jgi:hypothetical protein